MSESQQEYIGENRNAPIWHVVGVVFLLMFLASVSFYYGSKNPAPSVSGDNGYSYEISPSTDFGAQTSEENSTELNNEIESFILESLIGYGSTSVEQSLRASGFFVNTRYTNGDPSINARINNGCPVVDQDPPAGTEVYAGSTITILADCPLTGDW